MRIDHPIFLGVGASAASFILDQTLKSGAISVVAIQGDIQVNSWLNIVSVQNTGVAFGIATGSRPWVLIAVGLTLALVLSMWLFRTKSKIQAIGLGLAIGGAFGNIVDRITRGSVRDFLDFHSGSLHWPAFNMADVFILIGLSVVIFVGEQSSGDPAKEPGSGNGSEQASSKSG